MITQHIDDRVFRIALRHIQCLISDVGVLLFLSNSFNAHSIFLIALGQLGNRRRHSRREEQGLALFRGFRENKLKIFTKAKVQHFVSFVQHNGLQL